MPKHFDINLPKNKITTKIFQILEPYGKSTVTVQSINGQFHFEGLI